MIAHIEMVDAAALTGQPGTVEATLNGLLDAAGLAGTRRAFIMLSRSQSGGPLFNGLAGVTLRIEYRSLLFAWQAEMIKNFVMPLLSGGDRVALFVVFSQGTETQAGAIAGIVRRYAGLSSAIAAPGQPDTGVEALLVAAFDRRAAARQSVRTAVDSRSRLNN